MDAIRKLRGRPLHHLLGRSVQRVRAGMERWGWPVGTGLPDAEELGDGRPPDTHGWLEELRSGAWPRPTRALENPAATAYLAQTRWPEEDAETVRRAERILEGRFDLLGYRDIDFGDPVEWHLDPVADRRSPRVHWSRVPYLDPAAVGDHKVIWELNRHQWLVTLGRAYRSTGEDRFARAIGKHFEDWMDRNPPGEGINWASSLEVAFRAVAWIWTLHLFRDSPRLTPHLFVRILRHLAAHGRHVRTYLSTWFSPNTHLTGEALGLVYLGALLPRLPEADDWLEMGLGILTSELERQVYPDGVYFEQATWYHRYTVDIYLHLLVLSRRHDLKVQAAVEDRLELALDHLAWLVRPDGSIPRVGDDDGGRLLFLDARAPGDVRSTLATGAALYGREDWAHVAGEPSAEMLWLLGREGLQALEALEPQTPDSTGRGFPDGGFYVTRNAWTRTGNHLLIRCGSPGGSAGHAHADALSFDLTVAGVPLVVDPGTGSYADPELRNRLRGEEAHSALTLDSEASAEADEAPFRWKSPPEGEPEAWLSTDRFAFFRGRNSGFRRRGVEATHVRELLSLTNDYWMIRDRLEGDTEGPASAHLQFAPGTRLRRDNGGLEAERTGTDGTGARLRVVPFGIDGVHAEEGIVSPLYGSVRDAPRARLETAAGRDHEILTFLTPGAGRCNIDAVKGEGGRMWLLQPEGTEARDLLILGGSSGASDASGITSNFTWTWLRRGGSNPGLREVVLLEGSAFRMQERDLVRSETALPWLAIRFEDERLAQVSAPAGAEFRLHLPGRRPLRMEGSPTMEEEGVRIPAEDKRP